MEIIEAMTYEQWEERHMQRARCEARARQNRWNKKHKLDRQQRQQRVSEIFYGSMFAIISLITVPVIMDCTFAALGVPLGIYMIYDGLRR